MYGPVERKALLARYTEKRKRRLRGPTCRYRIRKDLATSRPRIKGRFVKAVQKVVKPKVPSVVPRTRKNLILPAPRSFDQGLSEHDSLQPLSEHDLSQYDINPEFIFSKGYNHRFYPATLPRLVNVFTQPSLEPIEGNIIDDTSLSIGSILN